MRVLIFAGLLLIFLAFYFLVFDKGRVPEVLSPDSSSSEKPEALLTLPTPSGEITVAWIKTRTKEISLYPNFEEQLTSREAMRRQGCNALVSAGFYDKEGKPIGLFVSQGREVNGFEENRLFNGIFAVTREGLPLIAVSPSGQFRLAVQAGPLLIKGGFPQRISLETDKEARRIVAAVGKQGEVYFLVIYRKDSAYMGPTLKELPRILVDIEKELGVEFIDALNLDGGSASSFHSNGFSLGEITKVGGYFCIRGR